jgi:hypothetical protein
MMSNPNGISSDLTAAGRLSRKLVGERVEVGTTGIADEDTEQYVRFQPRGATVGAAALLQEVSEPLPAPDREEISSWQGFLSWCLAAAAASAAFVVDSQGFIIAASSEETREQYRGAGAELGYAAEQLARFDSGAGALRAIEVEYKRRMVTILRVGGDEALLITLVSSAAISQQVRSLILEQAELVLPMPE